MSKYLTLLLLIISLSSCSQNKGFITVKTSNDTMFLPIGYKYVKAKGNVYEIKEDGSLIPKSENAYLEHSTGQPNLIGYDSNYDTVNNVKTARWDYITNTWYCYNPVYIYYDMIGDTLPVSKKHLYWDGYYKKLVEIIDSCLLSKSQEKLAKKMFKQIHKNKKNK